MKGGWLGGGGLEYKVSMLYLANAFSLNMLGTKAKVKIRIEKITAEEVKNIIQFHGKFQSAIGHLSTANVLSELLGIEVPHNRTEIKLEKGDVLIVFQVKARLEEGKVLSKEEILALPTEFFLIVCEDEKDEKS